MKVKNLSKILFYNELGEVLLQDRSTCSKHGEEWGFFGGGIELNETPEQAIIREVKEELDYDLDINETKYLGTHQNEIKPEYQVKRHIFICSLENKLDRFRVLEGAGMKLFSIEDAKKLNLVKGDSDILDLVKKND